MRLGLLAIALLFNTLVMASIAHTGPNPVKRSVQCRIVDATTGEALTGVEVSIEGTHVTTWSDEEGNFSLEIFATDNPKITCRLVSFETLSLDFSGIEEGATILLTEK
jgi:hypothetical protein